MKKYKKVLALLLALMMLLPALPVFAMADGDNAESNGIAEDAAAQTAPDVDGEASAFSLRPSYTSLNVDLGDCDLSAVPVSDLTKDMVISAGDEIWWDYSADYNEPDETFKKIEGDTVDLSDIHTSVTIKFIIGDGNQLNTDNKQYKVTVTHSYVDFNVYILPIDSNGNEYDKDDYAGAEYFTGIKEDRIYCGMLLVPDKYPLDGEHKISMEMESDHKILGVYEGFFDSYEEAESHSTNIKDDIAAYPNFKYKAKFDSDGIKEFTLVTELDGDTAVYKFKLGLEYDEYLEFDISDDNGDSIVSDWSDNSNFNNTGIIYQLESGYSLEDEYTLSIDTNYDLIKIVEGINDSWWDLEDVASLPDVKEQLLAGYKTGIKNPLEFTVFSDDGDGGYYIEGFTLTFVGNDTSPSSDVDFNIYDYYGIAKGGTSGLYEVKLKDDSAADQFGYRIELIDDSLDDNVDLSKIILKFSSDSDATVSVNGQKQISGESVQDFSKGPVLYTVTSGNGLHSKNYWVTLKNAVKGKAELFVVVDGEKPGEREVFINNATNNHHDVFIANIGTEALEGLSVEILDAQNVTLDSYWTVGGDGNGTLGAYTDSHDNVAKIRLLASGDGDIGGTLHITSDNGGSYDIELKGKAGNPKIITTDIANATKYVPYSFVIQSDNKYDWNEAYFYTEDKLPEGIKLLGSGELYGIPKETGTFEFTVEADYSESDFDTSTATFTITVDDNSDKNIAAENDKGYEIEKKIPDVITTASEMVFRSAGEFENFRDFYIDGQKLSSGIDYKAESGSTVITIFSQTFENFGEGKHTIAAEFRENGGDRSSDLKTTAQNYTMGTIGGGSSDDDGSDGGNGSSGGSDSSNGSGSSGGSSSGSGSFVGSMVSGSTGIGSTASASDIKNAVDAAGANSHNSYLPVMLRNIDYISVEQLKEITDNARQNGKSAMVYVDTLSADGKSVDVRLSFDPIKATKGVYVSGSTTNASAIQSRHTFERYFSNSIPAVVSLSHKGVFETPMNLCVKVPAGTVLGNLVFYYYDQAANKAVVFKDPYAWIDANNYLHLRVDIGCDIIISEFGLIRK